MTAHALTTQLPAPDSDGATIALYRTRVYRFSDDPRLYVLAEALEERWVIGVRPDSATLRFLRASLDSIRTTGKPLPFHEQTAAREGLDVQQELDARAPYRPRLLSEQPSPPTVFIVGAPRSGTSHLYNLLARTGSYAYFTTASCWAWPVRNLDHPARTSFEHLGEEVLTVDNKNTRLIPGLVMPYEAEDLYARTIPTYRHLGGHTYDLRPPRLSDAWLLAANIQAHCRRFQRQRFLTKSPFNSLRIPQLDAASGEGTVFLHMKRDQTSTAESMRRNGFHFLHHGRPLADEEAWELFASTIGSTAPTARTLTIEHAELLQEEKATVASVRRWIAARQPREGPDGQATAHTG